MSCNSCSNVTLPGVVGPAGAAGAAGSDGDSVVVLKIYIRASSTPSTPSGGSYDFSTHTLTAPASWSSGVPGGSNPCYVSNGTASVNGTTGTDSSITWSSPVLAFQNGADGVDGVPVLFMDTTGPNTASNNATSAGVNPIRTDQIDGGTIGTVGDFIKIKGEVIADTVDNYYPTVTIKFGGAVMFVWYAGISMGATGLKFEVDLVVSDTDEIRPHVSFTTYKSGVRLTQLLSDEASGAGGVLATSTSAITLGLNQNIEVEIYSDGVNTATLTYYEVTKYLKS